MNHEFESSYLAPIEKNPRSEIQTDRFLVCGLGGLGQNCVLALKKFGVKVSAIDINPPRYWEADQVPSALDRVTEGDCRQEEILKQAGVTRYRAIILVTGDERINIEAAFTARLLNPDIRLVIRSSQKNLNQLLGDHLGNLAAFEPTELCAPSFALAALGDRTTGCFYLENQLLQVLRYQVTPTDPLCGQLLENLNTRSHRIIAHCRAHGKLSAHFFDWAPDTRIQSGDTLVYIEVTGKWQSDFLDSTRNSKENGFLHLPHQIDPSTTHAPKRGFRDRFHGRLRGQDFKTLLDKRGVKIGFGFLAVVLGLLLGGSALFYVSGDDLSVADSFHATVVLLLGGYSDMLGSSLRYDLTIPWWLRVLGLLLTLFGTFLIGALYALLTGNILANQFQFMRRNKPKAQGQVVLFGLDQVGQGVANLLEEFQVDVTGVVKDHFDPELPPRIPVVQMETPLSRGLHRARVEGARSVVALTHDELINLEVCLQTQRLNPSCSLVMRTYHRRFSEHVNSLFPQARTLCASELAAEAFVAAAFGENVPSLFYQNNQAVLVTQYFIQADDTLHGRLLAEVAYGYGILPIVLTSADDGKALWMPSNDIFLKPGDHLTVLATSEGLRRVEKGELAPAGFRIRLKAAHSPALSEDAAFWMARILGLEVAEARQWLATPTLELPRPVYLHQGYRLVSKLKEFDLASELVP